MVGPCCWGGLCHPEPRTALFLGLGGGSLTQACLRFLPLHQIQVIELRQEVVRLAREFFGLSDDPRLAIRVADAIQCLPECRPVDLLFVDMYTDKGPGTGHFALDFLATCRRKLNPGGWLIVNQWADKQGRPMGDGLFRRLFDGQYWECPVSEGNVILWVPADALQSFDAKALLRRCRGLDLGYSLLPLLKAVRRPS